MSTLGDQGLARDYDELASMLGAVEVEARRYRALFDAAPAALMVTDDSLLIVDANVAALRLLGADLPFLVHKPLSTFIDPRDRRAFRRWEVRVRGNSDERRTNVRMRRRSGVAFEADLEATPGADGMYWAVRDRTEDAQADARAWEMNRELEHRVAAQSNELETVLAHLPVGVGLARRDGSLSWTNDAAQALLETAPGIVDELSARMRSGRTQYEERLYANGRAVHVEAVPLDRGSAILVLRVVDDDPQLLTVGADFVQNAAHQLRNPLAAIISSVAALEAGASEDPVDRERFVTHIGREGARMAQLVEALLTLAGLEQGVGLPLLEVVPLRPLLADAASATGGERTVVTCPDDVAVVADRDLVGQAVENVIANAVQHGGDGPVTVNAELVDESSVRIDVSDTGPGVPDEARPRVFERFYRAGGARRSSGLGLAIAKAAIHATKGRLDLLPSEPGTGATFRFTLPGARLL